MNAKTLKWTFITNFSETETITVYAQSENEAHSRAQVAFFKKFKREATIMRLMFYSSLPKILNKDK